MWRLLSYFLFQLQDPQLAEWGGWGGACYQNQFAGSKNKSGKAGKKDWSDGSVRFSLSPILVLYFWVSNLFLAQYRWLLLLLPFLLCHFIVQCSGRLLCFSKMRYKQEQRIKVFLPFSQIHISANALRQHTMFVRWLSWPSCNLCSSWRADCRDGVFFLLFELCCL